MKRLLVTVSTAAAIALFAPLSEVEAQSNTKPVIAPPSRTINLTAEQSFMIKEIVLKDLNVPKHRPARRNRSVIPCLPVSSSMT
jgi:hypothetical protein